MGLNCTTCVFHWLTLSLLGAGVDFADWMRVRHPLPWHFARLASRSIVANQFHDQVAKVVDALAPRLVVEVGHVAGPARQGRTLHLHLSNHLARRQNRRLQANRPFQ